MTYVMSMQYVCPLLSVPSDTDLNKTFVANNLYKSKVNFILYACVDNHTCVHKSILKGIVNVLSSKKMSLFNI